MIACFPEFYPNELLYSLLARYYDHSGHLTYRGAAADLLENTTHRPNPEFLNRYTDDALHCITRRLSMEEIILQHTMFPAYARFLPTARRQKAFRSLAEMDRDFCNALPMPNNVSGEKRHLRYCPLCAARDRDEYGETYWHRVHQIVGVNVCPEHGYYLIDSTVLINACGSPSLISAERAFCDVSPLRCKNQIEIALAQYTWQVFKAPLDMERDVMTGDFLNSRLEGTRYVSRRGGHRNMVMLEKEFFEFYRGLTRSRITEDWQLQKVFGNVITGITEVSMVAFFLGLSVSDLCQMRLPEKSQTARFDEQVRELHQSGLSYPQIARQMGAAEETVKSAGRGKFCGHDTERRRMSRGGGCRKKDWASYDAQMLPRVQKLITELQGNGNTKPIRITIGAVERLLPLPSRSIDHMPRCKALVKRHVITQEEHWARLIEWAIRTIRENGGTLNWHAISRLTNMRKRYVIACIPYLHDGAMQIIKTLLPALFVEGDSKV